ncbi:conserved hypothetical protein [Hyphomicrobiales bacterium]|nr:conserved hypothetical protein [Hyphomicrobiales bacterium]CAH1702399.1 hypothetical protein BOSEA1005_30271 [Hyphomicrobiales bacterium]CAI0346599.1 conserved hypothetical protein [Hyphomicrobiales bacterium]
MQHDTLAGPTATSIFTNPILDRLRQEGWTVASHCDVVGSNGKSTSVWLFTHPCGLYLRGEGATDCEAIAKVESQTLADPLIGTMVAMKKRIQSLEKAADRIMPYLRYTVGPESPGHHPTMPSAVGAFSYAVKADAGLNDRIVGAIAKQVASHAAKPELEAGDLKQPDEYLRGFREGVAASSAYCDALVKAARIQTQEPA